MSRYGYDYDNYNARLRREDEERRERWDRMEEREAEERREEAAAHRARERRREEEEAEEWAMYQAMEKARYQEPDGPEMPLCPGSPEDQAGCACSTCHECPQWAGFDDDCDSEAGL